MIINPYDTGLRKDVTTKNSPDEKTTIIDDNVVMHDIIRNLVLNNSKEIEKADRQRMVLIIKKYLDRKYRNISQEISNSIIDRVINKILGYDIIQKHIEDKEVSDIRIVKYDHIYIKKKGCWERTGGKFKTEEEFEEFVRYAVLKNGSVINYEEPIVVVSDRKNHMRIEAGIPPSNILGPSICFRIHRFDEKLDLEKLLAKYEMFDLGVYNFLLKAVQEGKNIIICGKGGSGKTTLLRALIDRIPQEMAITTNEETAELYLKNKNIIQREVISRKKQESDIDLEKLMRHSLVMSNDVIIIGELKGKEANTFFDAISTGHIGYATVHSDSSQNTLDRIIVLIKKDIRAQGYSEKFLREFLARTIDYIIYMDNYKISNISEVKIDEENGRVVINDKFKSVNIPYGIKCELKTMDDKLSYLEKVE